MTSPSLPNRNWAAPHLGERVSALADGHLGHDVRDRLLAHVATCGDCRTDLDAERRVKAMLTSAAGPAPSVDLLDRLRLIGAGLTGDPLSAQAAAPPIPRAPAPVGRVGVPARPATVAGPTTARTDPSRPAPTRSLRADRRRTDRSSRPRLRLAAAGAFSVAAAAAITMAAMAAGGSGSSPSTPAPAVIVRTPETPAPMLEEPSVQLPATTVSGTVTP